MCSPVENPEDVVGPRFIGGVLRVYSLVSCDIVFILVVEENRSQPVVNDDSDDEGCVQSMVVDSNPHSATGTTTAAAALES